MLVLCIMFSNKKPKHGLDSYYLWHYCLGHINKKCMDMLQHDGLLQPTHDESHEKYKSCISGKMARNPFPHQVERAHDLLGLIHTDVCGPFRTVSIKGASYFITFIDDFSCYGFIYLMKHKHEVFETFNVIHNEVEKQLGLELIQEKDTQPSKNTSKGVLIRRFTRIPRVPDRYGYYVDIEEYELGELNEPPNYKAALADPKSDKWHEAMNTEMQSKKDNQIWYLVDLPSNGRTIGCKWLFKKKSDMDGNIDTFKAHLIAIRILLAIVKFYDYKIWKMDVKTSFLNGHLSEDVYMVQPEGFVDLNHPKKVCKLQRSIYGLKQASRSWNKRFDEEIKKIGFTQNPNEPCIYFKASGCNVAFPFLYVDDILLMGNSVAMLQEGKSWLCKCFSMKDLGEVTYILGIKIIRDRSKWLISLSQSAYLEKTLKKFRIENSKKGYTPMIEKPDYRKSQGAKTPTEVQCMQRVPYALAIGSIMYAVRYTRPDVAYAQNLSKPEDELKVSCYADASFQTDKEDTKSQTGYVFILNGGAMD
ncbi:retrotransposon protein, putative, ty1-copia subclass [Tanacetum coccineum]